MSRRRRHDGLSDKVASSFLRDDLMRLLHEGTLRDDEITILTLIYLEGKSEEEVAAELGWSPRYIQRTHVEGLREMRSRIYEERLTPYLYSGDRPTKDRLCRVCGLVMARPRPGRSGRRREFCGDTCRQALYRARQADE